MAIGTLTLSTAIIGVLGFFGINNVTELKGRVLNMIGKSNKDYDVTQDGDNIEIRKNGKLVIKADLSVIEEMVKNSEDDKLI